MIKKTGASIISEIHPTNVEYRPDIDGLRAFAVISVLFFHAFPEKLAGGFIGVDIFFVISGFLISNIILNNLTKKRFSFLEFYVRRINRIFPALILILISCVAIGWGGLTATEFQQLGQHVVGGASFISNFILWNESGYFDNKSETKPLLHLWSLGIEEQFYIFWPILLWMATKSKLNSMTAIFITIFASCSFVLNLEMVEQDLVHVFYSPLTRIWEFAVGAILVCLQQHETKFYLKVEIFQKYILKNNNKIKIIIDGLSLSGLVILVICFYYISKLDKFPGWIALLPVIGTLLIIAAGKEALVNKKILSCNFLVHVGLISYPLYLWHWVILTFGRILTGSKLNEINIIFLVGLSFFMAYITFFFIEKRIYLYRSSKIFSVIMVILITVVAAVGQVIVINKGYESRYKIHFNDYRNRAKDSMDSGRNMIEDSTLYAEKYSLNKEERKYFRIVKNTQIPYVALLGDSHAAHLLYGFVNSPDESFNKVIMLATSSCPAAINFEDFNFCKKSLEIYLSIIEKTKSIEYVVIGTSFYGPNLTADKFAKTIDRLIAADKKVVFITDAVHLPDTAEKCVSTRLPFKDLFYKYPDFCNGLKLPEDVPNLSDYEKMAKNIKKINNNFYHYNPNNKLFCDSKECKVTNEGKLLFEDSAHLSIYGSEYLATDLIRKLNDTAGKWPPDQDSN